MIRTVDFKDSDKIAEIYNYYINETIITFEEDMVTSAEITNRIKKVLSSNLPWIVLEENNSVAGFAYASTWKERKSYRYTVEITVYLDPNLKGKGYGTRLYEKLFSELEKTNVHSALGCISLPNEASIKLHEKFGMKKVAHFSETGYKFNKWIDVGYWHKILK